MTALRFAIEHASLVEALEETCPPVCAPYLQAAYDRMRTGVLVRQLDTDLFLLETPFIGTDGAQWYQREFGTEGRTIDLYFRTCSQLSPQSSSGGISPCAPDDAASGTASAAGDPPPIPAASLSDPALNTSPVNRHDGSAANWGGVAKAPPAFSSVP